MPCYLHWIETGSERNGPWNRSHGSRTSHEVPSACGYLVPASLEELNGREPPSVYGRSELNGPAAPSGLGDSELNGPGAPSGLGDSELNGPGAPSGFGRSELSGPAVLSGFGRSELNGPGARGESTHSVPRELGTQTDFGC